MGKAGEQPSEMARGRYSNPAASGKSQEQDKEAVRPEQCEQRHELLGFAEQQQQEQQ